MIDPTTISPQPDKQPRRRKWLRRLVWLVVALALIFGAAVATLQTNWAHDRIRLLAERELSSSLNDGRVAIGSLNGNLLHTLVATDIRVFSGDSLVISVDTLAAEYNILSFLTNSVRVQRLDLLKPVVFLRQRSDATWDLLNLVPADTTSGKSASEPLEFRLDHVRLEDGRGAAVFHALSADSTVVVRDADIRARDVFVGAEGFGATIDEGTASIVAPVAPDTVTLTVRGEIGEDRLVCSTCRLASVRSEAVVSGHLLFSEAARIRGDLSIRLDPLVIGDVAFALPSADPAESVVGTARLIGSPDSLSAAVAFDFSSGAAVRLDAVVRTGDAAFVSVDGSVERFDPAVFLPGLDLTGSVNATIDANLKGNKLQTVDGPVDLRVYDTVLNDVRLRNGHLSGRIENGKGAFDATLYLPGLSLTAAGTVMPFADTLAYDVEGSLVGASVSKHYAAVPDIDEVEARFKLGGKGSSFDQVIAHGVVDLRRLTSSKMRLGPSRASIDLNNGSIALNGNIALRGMNGEDAGDMRVDAALAIEDGIWQVDAGRLFVDDIRPHLIIAEAPVGLISGSGRVTGEFGSDSLVDVRGELSVSGVLDAVTLSQAKIAGNFTGALGDYDVAVESSIGRLEARGNVVKHGNGLEISSKGMVADLDIDTLSTATLATRITGSFDARTHLVEGRPASLTLQARLDRSVVNDQVINGALVTASLADSSLTFDVDVELPNGGLSGEGWSKPFADETEIYLRNGAFSHVNVGAWLDQETLTTDLSGSMAGGMKGGNIEGTLRISPSRVNRAGIKQGTVNLTALDSTFHLETDLEMDSGRAIARASGQIGRVDTTYQGLVRLREVDLSALMGLDSLSSSVNAGCSFVGTNFDLRNVEASAFCTGKNSRIGEVVIDSVRLETSLDSSALAVSGFFLDSNVARMTSSGTLPVRAEAAGSKSEIELTVEVKDLAPAAAIVGVGTLNGEGNVTFTVGGWVGSPSLDIEASLAFLTFDQYRVSSIDGFASIPDLEEGHGVAALDVGFSVYNGVPVQRTSIELEKTDDTVVLTAEARIDNRRRGNLSARFEQDGDNGLLIVDAVNLNLEGEVWKLSQEASFEIGDRWSVRTFLLFSDDQQIALDGYVDPDGEQNLIITLERIRLGAFSDLIGYPGVNGIAEGYAILSGAHDDLQLESNVSIEALKAYGSDVGRFDLSATYQNQQMDLEGKLSHLSGSSLALSGFVPFRLTMTGVDDLVGTEPVQLEIRSDSVSLSWIRPFLDQTVIDRINGHLVCDVSIGGTWDEPSLSGNASFTNGRIRLPKFQLDMRAITGSFRLEGEQLLVDDFVANSKGGTLQATGSVGFRSLDDPTFDIDAKLNKFRAISTETYRMTVSGNTKLTGSFIRPVFGGKVSLEESDIYMTEELMSDEVDPVRLTDRDLRILERRFGYRVGVEDTTTWDFYEALDLTLETRIGRDVWLRSYANPKMDVEFSGDLSIRKPPLADETLSGTINVNPSRSRVISFARKFEITSGTIQFNGIVDEALVDVKAQYVVPSRFGGDEVKINLAISGQFDDMHLELSSDPQMDTGAMVSYLTTGRPPGEGSVGGSQAAELAVSSLSNLVEGFANSELGLDVVEIQVSPATGTYLTVGKYVSPRIYVSLTQPLVTNDSYQASDTAHQTEMAIEYELISWLVAQIGSSRNQLQVNMIWEFAF